MTELRQIPLLQGKALLVELPEGAESIGISDYEDRGKNQYPLDNWWLTWHVNYEADGIDLPGGNWRIIGMLNEVTEEQAAGVVDEPYESGIEQYTEPDDVTGWIVSEAPMGTKYSKVMYKGYRDYTKDPDGYSAREINPFGTALESLESAIEAEGYLMESPHTPKCGCFGPAEEGACPACDEWVESQSRVLDRSRCLLLGRADG